MPLSEFDTATAVTRSGATSYDALLHDAWRIGNALNGGILLSLVGAALRDQCAPLGHPDPLTVSAYYLSASVAGPARLDTTLVRRGKTLTTSQVSLSQDVDGDPTERIRALATYGDLDSLPDSVHVAHPMPPVPGPDDCLSSADLPDSFMAAGPFLERVDVRMDPATAGWATGEGLSKQGLIQAWVRLPDGREPDPLLLLMMVDVLPPVTFTFGHFGWVPTLELTAHVRAHPAPGWLFVRHATRNYTGGLLEEDAEVWDSTGRLVAQSRQLARAPRRRQK